ncbi:MAG TPA: intein-containing Rv2578c family radical SAM protein [Actinomycetota bacterium]|jgi:DNA repair photolyase
MRWDNLRLVEPEGKERMTLPLFEQGAVVRRFDTPEFRGITFYEVRAKSIINHVPEASRVPFRWTINPYRGCSHACRYCLQGETPILMANGCTKPLAKVRVGDDIYGTARVGNYRRYTRTQVLAHWATVKSAYRITLEDGTQLIASGDHRFLSDRGWKHVTGREQGRERRPFLTLNNKLIGTGRFAEPPKDNAEYRAGYLSGMIRGDGYLGSYSYFDTGGRYGIIHQFRLALVDVQALQRTREYLVGFGIRTTEFVFQRASVGRKEMTAIRATSRESVLAIEEIIRWPASPTDDWRKGFLAGIFDAEGGFSGCVRISNTDRAILDQIKSCLRRLGFSFIAEPPRTPTNKPVTYIRLLGGLRECLRFFHTMDPAITRKRTIDGIALNSDAPLRVVSIEPLGMELRMFDITTGTGDFIADGVVSHNCFARNTHTYLDLDYGEDFNSQIVVKLNAPELLRKELARKSWNGEHIAMGTNVDPYQRAEGRYKLMRGILEALRDFANPFSILTKGSLILRDLDLLQQCAEVAEVGTNVSVGFVEMEMWRLLEPGTPSPIKRLEVCRKLNEAGIPCGVLMAPIIPFLTDSPHQLAATVRQIVETGATHLAPIVLHLRTGAREWYMRWLSENYPDLVPRYERLYGRSAYAPEAYQEEITGRVHELADRYGIGQSGPREARRVRRREEPLPPEQMSLL